MNSTSVGDVATSCVSNRTAEREDYRRHRCDERRIRGLSDPLLYASELSDLRGFRPCESLRNTRRRRRDPAEHRALDECDLNVPTSDARELVGFARPSNRWVTRRDLPPRRAGAAHKAWIISGGCCTA